MERTAPSLTGRGFARPRNLPRAQRRGAGAAPGGGARRPAAADRGTGSRPVPGRLDSRAGPVLHDDLNLAGGLLLKRLRGRLGGALPRSRRCLRPQLLDYKERSSPRSQVSGEVSTEHPVDQPIFLHNEQSYTADWPLYIMFHCQVAPLRGRRHSWRPTGWCSATCRTNCWNASGAWASSTCATTAPASACPGAKRSRRTAAPRSRRSALSTGSPMPGSATSTCAPGRGARRSTPPVYRRAPVVQPRHVLPCHQSRAGPARCAAAQRRREDLPYQTYYGDGSPIEAQTLATIRSAIDRETRRFDWRVGDVLILDNMLAQHGREPFRGPRRILTIMSRRIPAWRPPMSADTFAPGARRCRMSASFSAPRLRPGSSRPATWWRKACSTRPTTTCASSARASQAWTCGNGSPPPAQGCATACCGMAASCFVASR